MAKKTENLRDRDAGKVEKRRAICGVCPGGCGIIATLRDGKLVKVEPDKAVPFGCLCIRGKAGPEIAYSPDRLKTPLVRAGERGVGKFREASWDEALDRIATSMKKIRSEFGARAFAYHSGRGVFEQSMADFGQTFLYPYGSPNMGSVGSLCFNSFGVLAPISTFGLRGPSLVPDMDNSKTIVFWGANPITDSPPFAFHQVMRAKQRGARIIAIDHMKSDIARRASLWVPVRSGTDGALALGMIRVVINEGLYDKELVERWTAGFDELREYVQSFTPEFVKKETGVPEKTLVNLAREIASTKHVSLRTYTGLEYTNSGVQNIRAVYILWALTGHLDTAGGLVIGGPPPSYRTPEVTRPPENVKPIGADSYPLFHELVGTAQFMDLPAAVLEGKPYPVKGLIVHGASMLTSYPQTRLWRKTFLSLDFLAVIDIFMTAEARFADVVLPAATESEIRSYQHYPGYVRLREPVVPPPGQARNNLLILGAIAKRLGYGHLFPQTEDDILRAAFARNPALLEELKKSPLGVHAPSQQVAYRKWEAGLLRRDRQPGFETPTGKIELTATLLARHGYDALPTYSKPQEGASSEPELRRAYPLILNTGARIQSTFRSQHQNIPSLLRLQEKPLVLISPADAGSRGIADGDRVVVRTRRGRVRFWAKVTPEVVRGSVELNVGGGKPIHAKAWREANANNLTDMRNRDPISGFPVLKALLCEVEKAAEKKET